MPPQPDPYTRSYWRFVDEFPEVYASDRDYATWSRLRDIADMAWPTSAALPMGTDPDALDVLVRAELVFVQTGGRYRIRGMDKHRSARSERGRKGAEARWSNVDAGRDAPADADAMPKHRKPNASSNAVADVYSMQSPSRAEPSRAKPRVVEGSISGEISPSTHSARAPNGEAEDWMGLQGLAERLTQQPFALANRRSKLGEMAMHQLAAHGLPKVTAAWTEVAEDVGDLPTIRQIILGADDRLNPIPSAPRQSAAERKKADHDAALAKVKEDYLAGQT